MKRRIFLNGLGAVAALQLGLAAAAFAATAADQIVAQLRDQGFTEIEVEQTWLGRTRIVAERGNASREIILNPSTGEILRDLWLTTGDKGTPKVQIGRDDGNDRPGDEDDDGDDVDSDSDSNDDDEDSDNSGSGSSGDGGGDD